MNTNTGWPAFFQICSAATMDTPVRPAPFMRGNKLKGMVRVFIFIVFCVGSGSADQRLSEWIQQRYERRRHSDRLLKVGERSGTNMVELVEAMMGELGMSTSFPTKVSTWRLSRV